MAAIVKPVGGVGGNHCNESNRLGTWNGKGVTVIRHFSMNWCCTALKNAHCWFCTK